MTAKHFGKNITKIRKEQNMTQREFADSLDVSHATVSKWELDKSVPSHEHIAKICELYSVDANFMYESNSTVDTKAISDCVEHVNEKLDKKEKLCLIKELVEEILYQED